MSSPAASLTAPGAARTPFNTPNFDRVARIYRWAEYLSLGPLLKRTREQFLPQVAHAQHALILGDGDGRFTAALLAKSPHLSVRAVDTSASMLRLLRLRCTRIGAGLRLTTEQISALSTTASPGTDLVATHFLLDCLTQPEINGLAARIASQVNPGCLWVISEFGLPHNRLLRPFAAAYLRLLYLAFRVLTGLRPQRLPDPQYALKTAGFTLLRRVERLGGLLYSELWQLPTRRAPSPSHRTLRNFPTSANIHL